MATTSDATLGLTPEYLNNITDMFRARAKQSVQGDFGYNLYFGRCEQVPNKKLLDKRFSDDIPILIKDKEDKVWIYGYNPDTDETVLTPLALDQKYVSELTSTAILDCPTPPILQPKDVPVGIYEDIGNVNGHIDPDDHTDYTLATAYIDNDLDINFLNNNYFTFAPMLIKDKNDNLFIYGYDEETGTNKLSDLAKKFNPEEYPTLKFNVKLVPFILPQKMDSKDIPPEVYKEITLKKGHKRENEQRYDHFPAGMDEKAQSEEVEKMRAFVDSQKLRQFVEDFSAVMAKFSNDDLDSLGTKAETETAKEFVRLWNLLEANGFSSRRGEILNFWSGDKGAYKAQNIPGEVSSSQSPIVLFMLDLRQFLPSKNNRITEAISKKFALGTSGTVNVYISSNKRSDPSSLTVGNNFWNAELFTLQEKLRSGEIDSIRVHLYDAENQQWSDPIDINSREADAVLFMVRRYSYQPTMPEQLKRIENQIKECAEVRKAYADGRHAYSGFDDWCANAPPREALSLGTLRRALHHWKAQTEKNILNNPERKMSVEEREKRLEKQVLHQWKKVATRSEPKTDVQPPASSSPTVIIHTHNPPHPHD